MPRTPKSERRPAETLAPVPAEILDQFAPDRPLSAAEVESATRRFKKALISRPPQRQRSKPPHAQNS